MKEMFGYICCVIGLGLGAASLYYGWGWLAFCGAAVLFIYGVLVIRAARRNNHDDSLFDDAVDIAVDLLDD